MPKPRILGADGAGTVEALGEGVDGLELGQRVVINPGLEHGRSITVVGEHTDGTNARADRAARDERLPARRRAVVRGGGRVPARLRDRVPHARTRAGLVDGEWVLVWGIGGGVATAALDDREGARRARARHLVERREARARSRARRRRRRQPRDRGRRRGREGGDRRRGDRRRRRARRRGDVEDLARRRRAAAAGSPSAVRRAARTRPRSSTASGGSSSRSSARRWARARTSRLPTSSCAAGARSRRSTASIPLEAIREAHERLEAGEQLGKIVLAIP